MPFLQNQSQTNKDSYGYAVIYLPSIKEQSYRGESCSTSWGRVDKNQKLKNVFVVQMEVSKRREIIFVKFDNEN